MKMKFKRFLSGVMAVATLASVIVQPVAVSASELEPEEIPFEQQYPELKEVQDSLDPDEIVTANDIELAYGQEFEVEVDLSGIEGVDESKMKILFHEAKNDDGADFDIHTPDTYKAVYAVESVSGHPSYRISRNITVKEPETDSNGKSSATIVKTQDTVYLKEITAPKGYVLNTTACVNVLLSEKECPVFGEHKNRKGGLQNEDLENSICIEQKTKKQKGGFSMKEFWNMIRVVFTMLGGWIDYFVGECDGLICTLLAFVVVAYITDLMCAIADRKFSSEVGFKGICKKVLIFLLVGLANILDVNVIGRGNALRTAIIFFYISNEGVSLLENVALLGLPVPEKMKAVLERLHKKGEDG